MAKTKIAPGLLTKPTLYPHDAFSESTMRVTETLPAAASGDIIEFARLPAMTILTSVTVVTSGISATATLDIGILSGKASDKDSEDRVLEDELILSAVSKNNTHLASVEDLMAIPRSDLHRGIGLKASAAIAGGEITIQYSFMAV